MNQLNYFAYGSNMSVRRMLARIPSAQEIGRGLLQGHRLEFHKLSKDRSAKCDVVESEFDDVFGVLFRIAEIEKQKLDMVEGLNQGYDEKTVSIDLSTGLTVPAFVYIATFISADLQPYTWYKQHVLEGARKADLPDEYVKMIEEIEAISDFDKAREARELAIYR